MTRASSTLDVGTRLLDRYVLQRKLARGGMSVVFRADDTKLSRPVCVKIFSGFDPSSPSYGSAYEYFVQEAFVVSQLRHPHTVRIYDFGQLDDEMRSPFHVSELVEGGTLADHVRDHQTTTPRVALERLAPLIDALGEAHALGLVHRDVKPTNVLVGHAASRPFYKLADFGIAKAFIDRCSVPNRASDTSAHGVSGSFYSTRWAAPEQLRHQPIDPRTDLYSVGLLFAWMLTGRAIFDGDDDLTVYRLRAEGDACVARHLRRSRVEDAMATAIAAVCSDDPDARPASAVALLDSLHRALESGRSSAAPPAPATEIATDATRRPHDGASHLLARGELDRAVSIGGVVVHVRSAPLPTRVTVGDGPRAPTLRLEALPHAGGAAKLHVKGVDCFVARSGTRPSAAVDLAGVESLELLRPADGSRRNVRLDLGIEDDAGRRFEIDAHSLLVPRALAGLPILIEHDEGRLLVVNPTEEHR